MTNRVVGSLACFALLLSTVGLVVCAAAEPGTSLQISLSDADLTLLGEQDADWAGYFASPAGDVNGDGLSDVLIGAPMAGNKPPGSYKGEGKAYLFLGRPQEQWPTSPLNLSEADASFLGCSQGSMTARQVYTAGDVNGDGYDDFLISGWKCPNVYPYKGTAYLFLGRPDVDWGHDCPVSAADASFVGESPGDLASYYSAAAGDVNGDGYDDFLVGAPHNSEPGYQAGQVYLILGRAAADWGTNYPLTAADASFWGEAAQDRVGRSVVGAGDVNGDGYDDFLAGTTHNASGGPDAGKAYLVLGRAAADWGMDHPLSAADASFIGESSGDELGRRVAGAGDVNGDGLDDILLGASYNAQAGINAGKAYLILGRPAADWGTDYSVALADAAFLGEAVEDQAGRRVSSAGDPNADGLADFLIGAPHSARGGLGAGVAYLIYGRPEADWGPELPLSEADVAYVCKAEVGSAGYDVAWLGDVDGDAIDDFLVAAFGGRDSYDVPGDVYLLLGGSAPRPLAFAPDAPDGHVGEWHSFSGTYWDPNGRSDLSLVRMTLGRDPGHPMALDVAYRPASNALYLREPESGNWLGPCSPGEPAVLTNGVVELNCARTTVQPAGRLGLRVTWHGRWTQPVGGPREVRAFLLAADLSGNSSGLTELGSWTLLP